MAVADLTIRIDATVEGLRRQLAEAVNSLNRLEKQTAQSTGKIDASLNKLGHGAAANMERQTGLMQSSLNKLRSGVTSLQTSFDSSFSKMTAGFAGFQKAFALLGVGMGIKEAGAQFIKMADTMTTMENRLRSVTSSSAEMSSVFESLYRSSQDNSVATETAVELYARLSRALETTGIDAQGVVDIVDTLGKVAKLSGATVMETSSAMIQLSQALNSGKLQGEEFRAMAESMPSLLNAVAEEAAKINGISFEEAKASLKEMAANSEIDVGVIISALQNMREEAVKDFEEVESTTAAAVQRMWNALTRLIGRFDDVSGASGGIVSRIDSVTSAFDGGVGALDRYGGALQTLLGWINSIPHPLSLLAQAAAGAAAQVAQAVGEIEAKMKAAGDYRARMEGAAALSFPELPGGMATSGSVAKPPGIEGLRNKLAGGLKVIEATGGRPVAPAITDPMAVAKIAGSNVDFTTFGATRLGTPTGVTRDKPKLHFYKPASKDQEKASEKEKQEIESLTEKVRTPQEEFNVKVATYKAWLDSKKIDEQTYSRAFTKASQEMTDDLMKTARERADPSPGKKGGGGKPKKSEEEKAEEKAQKAAVREGKSVFKETRTIAEAYGQEIERLDELLARNAITHEDHARAVAEANLAMQENQAAFTGGQEAAQAYLDKVAQLQGMVNSGAMSQDEYNARVLEAQSKYATSKSGAAEYAGEVARLDAALKSGAISEEEHAASMAVAQAQMNEGLQEGARLWEETRTPVERYYEQLRKINELWEAGAIGDDTRLRAAKQAWEEMRNEVDETSASMKAAKALGDDLGMSFASAFEDAILEGGKLRDIMKGLWEDIQRIVVRQMVTVPLATGLSSIMTGVTGAMMGGGAAALPPMPGTPGGGFAEGGFVRGPGSGASDSIPAIMPGGGLARLSNGEFIVNARSAAKYERLLTAINNGAPGRAFAMGGPIGSFPSRAGGAGNVQIVLENKSSVPLKTEGGRQEGPGPDGKTMIRVMVVDAVKGALASGEFDRTMGARYGAGVQPIAR